MKKFLPIIGVSIIIVGVFAVFGTKAIPVFVFLSGIAALCFLILWIFHRIADIGKIQKNSKMQVELLQRMSDDETKCDCCSSLFPKKYMRKIESGQLLCPECMLKLTKV